MNDAAARITRLIQRSDRAEWGRECGGLLAEAITLADAAGEEQLAYAARMRQVSNATMMDDAELVLATFAVCDDAHRRDPLRFPADPKRMRLPGLGYDFADLHWMWKWIPTILMAHPRFGHADVEDSLAGLEETYRAAGLTSQAVPQRHLNWAVIRGDADAIRHWRDVAAALPPDDNADCEACSRSTLIEAALHLDDTPAALTLLDEIVDGDFGCAEEPAVALSHMLPTLAREGRPDAVRTAVAEILANQEVVTAHLGAAGRLVAFLTQAGQPERALVIARRALPKMGERPLNGTGQLALLTGLAVACDALVARGNGSWPVPQADDTALGPWLAADEPHTVSSLADAARRAAHDLAAAFDARNGTDRHARTLADTLAQVDHGGFDLDLGLPPDAAAAFVATDGDPGLLFRLSDAPVPVPADGDDALRIATELVRGGRHAEAVDVARVWLPRLEDPAARAAMVYRLGAALVGLPPEAGVDPDAVTADLCAAVEALGWPEGAAILAEVGPWAFRPLAAAEAPAAHSLVKRWLVEDRPEEAIGFGVAFLRGALTDMEPRHLAELGDAAGAAWSRRLGGQPAWWSVQRAPILLRAVASEADAAHRAEVLRLVDAALEDATGMDAATLWSQRAELAHDPEDRVNAALNAYRHTVEWAGASQRALFAVQLLQVCGAADRFSEVMAVASFLRRLAPSLPPAWAGEALRAASLALLAADADADAAEAADEAIAALDLAADPEPTLAAVAHLARAEAAQRLREPRVAIDHLLRAADLHVAAEQPVAAADAALEAAFAHLALGSPADAGELAETVLGLVADQAGAWEQRLRAHHAFALAAARVGDAAPPETVETAFDEALALAASPPPEVDAETADALAERVRTDKARWLTYRGRHDEARGLTESPPRRKDS